MEIKVTASEVTKGITIGSYPSKIYKQLVKVDGVPAVSMRTYLLIPKDEYKRKLNLYPIREFKGKVLCLQVTAMQLATMRAINTWAHTKMSEYINSTADNPNEIPIDQE